MANFDSIDFCEFHGLFTLRLGGENKILEPWVVDGGICVGRIGVYSIEMFLQAISNQLSNFFGSFTFTWRIFWCKLQAID